MFDRFAISAGGSQLGPQVSLALFLVLLSTMIYDLRRKAVDNSQQRELDLLAKFPGGRLLLNWPIVSPLPVWLTVERGVRGK